MGRCGGLDFGNYARLGLKSGSPRVEFLIGEKTVAEGKARSMGGQFLRLGVRPVDDDIAPMDLSTDHCRLGE